MLFNDDVFLINSVEPTVFFKNGLPCDYAALSVFTPFQEFDHIIVNNMSLVNNHFTICQCFKEHPEQWFSLKDIRATLKTLLYCYPFNMFPGFINYHNALSFTKSEFTAMWQRFPEQFTETAHHRFRCNEDVTVWAIRYWRLASGQFYPMSQKYSCYIGLKSNDSFVRAVDIISCQKKKEICLNDIYQGNEFEKHKKTLQRAFESILPTPCSFEIS